MTAAGKTRPEVCFTVVMKLRCDAVGATGSWYPQLLRSARNREHISQTTPWDVRGSKADPILTDSFSSTGEMKLLSRDHEDISMKAVN